MKYKSNKETPVKIRLKQISLTHQGNDTSFYGVQKPPYGVNWQRYGSQQTGSTQNILKDVTWMYNRQLLTTVALRTFGYALDLAFQQIRWRGSSAYKECQEGDGFE